MEELNEVVRDWAAKLIGDKGGPNKVSKETGINYMVLRHITKKERYPTWDVLAMLHQQWPDEVNLNALASGKIEEAGKPDSVVINNNSAGNGSPESKYQAAEFERLSRELEQERLNSQHKEELLKKEEKHNQSLSLLLENFQEGVTNDPSAENDIRLVRYLAVANFGGSYGRG